MKGRVWFTIDIAKALRESGYPKDAEYFAEHFGNAGNITVRFAEPSEAERPAPLKPELSSLYVDDNGQLKIKP